MLIEVYECNGLIYHRDINGLESSTSLIASLLKEAKAPRDLVKGAIDLKDAGFSPDEIFKLFKKVDKDAS